MVCFGWGGSQNVKHKGNIETGAGSPGFSRVDVLAVMAVVVGLIFLLVKVRGGRHREVRRMSCQENLKQISVAMAAYSAGNNQKLPFAFMQPRPGAPTTWDTLIATSLRVALRCDRLDMPPPPHGSVLKCPEDSVSEAVIDQANARLRRSYAMTAHKMNRPNWPPSERNATGVGLSWSQSRKRGNSSYSYLATVSDLPAVTLGMIFEADATILMTEHAHADNFVGRSKRASIISTMEHVDATVLPMNAFHRGRINYLMVDGHVELLDPEETVGVEGEVSDASETHFGMWTIVAGD